MRFVAACSRSAAAAVFGREITGRVLGAGHGALYVQVAAFSGLASQVIAVLSTDAVRLPCALVIPERAARLSLSSIAPRGEVTVGLGALRWACSAGDVTVSATRVWLPPHIPRLHPRTERCSQLMAALPWSKLPPEVAPAIGLARGSAGSVEQLLGRGPGLTPSGDDVLAGFVVAARAFGLDIGDIRAKIVGHAEGATTALSAQLLKSALAGEGVPEIVGLLRWLGGSSGRVSPVDALTAVGHTSGAAMAYGVALAVLAARSSSRSPDESTQPGPGKPANLERDEY
ncbi:MAG TPA: DUF2877 domain-containing protein [Streptosporangiaceae bacterium]|nr:DUF2877 domain-containing protein [Streptosporangiaceae bacterium]